MLWMNWFYLRLWTQLKNRMKRKRNFTALGQELKIYLAWSILLLILFRFGCRCNNYKKWERKKSHRDTPCSTLKGFFKGATTLKLVGGTDNACDLPSRFGVMIRDKHSCKTGLLPHSMTCTKRQLYGWGLYTTESKG